MGDMNELERLREENDAAQVFIDGNVEKEIARLRRIEEAARAVMASPSTPDEWDALRVALTEGPEEHGVDFTRVYGPEPHKGKA